MTLWILTNKIPLESVHLTWVPCFVSSCSIIYTDNLSHGFGPCRHSLFALALAVTCTEQLNAQKPSANQGKPIKALCYLAAIPWRTASCQTQLLIMRPVFVYMTAFFLFSVEPTCEFDARLGGDNVGLARQKRGGRQRNGHTLGQSHHLYWAFSIAVVLEACGTPPALQGAVSVHLTTYMEMMGACTEKVEMGRCWGYRRIANETYFTSSCDRVHISFLRGILLKLAVPFNPFKGMGSHSIKRLYLFHFN